MRTLVGQVVWKEVREIRRDPVTIGVALLLPLIMLFIFGSALSLDVRDAPLAVYDRDRSPASRALIEAFPQSGHFRIVKGLRGEREIGQVLDRGQARLVVVISEGFSRKLERGEGAEVQTLADGSFPATAMLVLGYADGVLQAFEAERVEAAPPVELVTRVWFNAPLESVNYIVPGLFAVILMAFPPLLTALAVVREKESGSVQQIFVSPIRPYEFIIGKAIPYAGIAFLQMLMILTASLWWFAVPFLGSVPLFLAATVVYVLCTVGLGLLISSLTRSQLVAMLLALLFTLMPSFLFSGFLYPIYTMPLMMEIYTWLFPARHFIEISRGIAMKDVGLAVLWPQLLLLILYTTVVFAITARLFRKKVA